MKKKAFTELKGETVEQLTARVATLKKTVLKESMPALGDARVNLKGAKHAKRDIAQLLTLITEKKNAEKKN